MIARLIARTHVETFFVVLFLVEHPEEAFPKLVGAYRDALEKMNNGTDDDFDVSAALSDLVDFERAQLDYATLALRHGQAADRPEFKPIAYDLVYRGLSTTGAHPNLWVFQQYLEVDEKAQVLRPIASPTVSHLASLRSAVVLTLYAAHAVFGSAGVGVKDLGDAMERLGVEPPP